LIRVAVAAASPVVRAGLEAILAEADGVRLVDARAEGELQEPADVLVLDIPPGADPEEAAHDAPPGPPLVVLSDDPDAAVLVGRGSARGVLPRDAAPDALVAAVVAAAAGLLVLPESAAPLLAEPQRATLRADVALDPPLTPREIEVLHLLADGLGNKGIARRLGISEHTVKAHVSAILGKLAAVSRAEAVAAGARLGLLML
jgi:DNA-binding NarL/FixJ family response regulator